jgi:hypothetical protein
MGENGEDVDVNAANCDDNDDGDGNAGGKTVAFSSNTCEVYV